MRRFGLAGGERPCEGSPSIMKTSFTEMFLTDLLPMIDKTYRTVTDRDHRASAGLSRRSNWNSPAKSVPTRWGTRLQRHRRPGGFHSRRRAVQRRRSYHHAAIHGKRRNGVAHRARVAPRRRRSYLALGSSPSTAPPTSTVNACASAPRPSSKSPTRNSAPVWSAPRWKRSCGAETRVPCWGSAAGLAGGESRSSIKHRRGLTSSTRPVCPSPPRPRFRNL
jgi:hypothetical protein